MKRSSTSQSQEGKMISASQERQLWRTKQLKNWQMGVIICLILCQFIITFLINNRLEDFFAFTPIIILSLLSFLSMMDRPDPEWEIPAFASSCLAMAAGLIYFLMTHYGNQPPKFLIMATVVGLIAGSTIVIRKKIKIRFIRLLLYSITEIAVIMVTLHASVTIRNLVQ